jgi:von Willebrand factor type A domain
MQSSSLPTILFFIQIFFLLVVVSPSWRTLAMIDFDYLLDSKISGPGSPIDEFHKELQDIYVRDSLSCCETNSDDWLIRNCMYQNYDQCQSQYPEPNCFETQSGISDCMKATNNSSCSTLFDYTKSTVRIPQSLYEYFFRKDMILDDDDVVSVIEGVCYPLQLDHLYFTDSVKIPSTTTISNNGVDTPQPLQIHYGTKDGIHRIFPGRASTSQNCPHTYDPRKRPWYAASSSGRKNIVLLLDLSSTISTGIRLQKMKDAAEFIISSTNIADNVALITFTNSTNTTYHEGTFHFASDAIQEEFRKTIISLQVEDTVAQPDYRKALNDTLSFISNQRENECETAILLFTDSDNNKLWNALEAIRTLYDNNQTDSSIAVFGYLLNEVVASSYPFPCHSFNAGVWSTFNVDKFNMNALRNFYEYYEFGLALKMSSKERVQTSIVEPYPFFSFGIQGTTVSMPLYDPRYNSSNGYRRLLGVVAVDYSVSDLANASGLSVDVADNKIKDRATREQDGSCPSMITLEGNPIKPSDLMFYSIDKFRNYALCTMNNETNELIDDDDNTTLGMTNEKQLGSCYGNEDDANCPTNSISYFQEFYLHVLWNNTNYRDLGDDYIRRGCCSQEGDVCSADPVSVPTSSPQSVPVGSLPTSVSSTESKSKMKGGTIAGIVISSMAIVFIMFGLILVIVRKRRKNNNSSAHQVAESMIPTGWNPPPSRVPSAPVMDD